MKNCIILKKAIAFLAIVLAIATGCKRTEIPLADSLISPNIVNVFVVGEERNQTNTNLAAKIWKNGVATVIGVENSTYGSSEANSVTVIRNEVYITGYQMPYLAGSCTRPSLDNPPYAITLETAICNVVKAYSTCSLGTDFYTAGVEGTKAVIWKNSTLQRLPTLIGNSSAAFSVVAQGTDVYAVGYESNGNVAIARVWKNGNPINLTDGITSGRATSIFVSGSDIYIVGTQENKIKIWKNNILANTIQGGYLPYNGNCIYVSGNDVYVCGSGAISSSNQNSVAKVWKNGVLTNLTNGTTSAYASAVFVFENDVYVAGVEANSLGIQVGKVWKNGVATNLTDGTRFANIKSIFIK